MDEQDIFSIELGGLFPDRVIPLRLSGTSGEILERIANEWGIEDDNTLELERALDGVYPSTRAIKAHHMIEDQLGKSGTFASPDLLILALIQDGMATYMTDEEYEDFLDEEELDEYEEARGTIDEEWSDGVWEM